MTKIVLRISLGTDEEDIFMETKRCSADGNTTFVNNKLFFGMGWWSVDKFHFSERYKLFTKPVGFIGKGLVYDED